MEADVYHSMIDCQDIQLSEPSVTKGFSTDQMLEKLKTKEMIIIPNFPNHTQAVERIIKVVTDASERVVSEEARNGHVRARIERRKNESKYANLKRIERRKFKK